MPLTAPLALGILCLGSGLGALLTRLRFNVLAARKEREIEEELERALFPRRRLTGAERSQTIMASTEVEGECGTDS